MESRALSLIRWYAGFAWRRLGWDLSAALICGVIAAVMVWQAWQSRDASRTLRTSLASIGGRAVSVPTQSGIQQITRGLEAFYANLPEQSEMASKVKRLFILAEKNGIQLSQGDYRPVPNPSAQVMRYQVTFPVRGEAKHIQGFILDALNDEPALGLEGMAFRRASATSGDTETRLRFYLLVRLP